MFYYLYEVRNNLNGKIYVGVHKAKSLDDGYMGSGKIITNAIKKYGIGNFSKVILETFDNVEDMYSREKEVVNDEFLAREDVYNIRRGGLGGFDHINNDPKKRLEVSEAARQYNIKNGIGGTKFWTEESYIKATKQALLNQKEAVEKSRSPEAIAKRKKTMKDRSIGVGEKNSQYGSHIYINIHTGEKKRYKEGTAPPEWIESSVVREEKMLNSKRWYNDGNRNYYFTLPNQLVEQLNLVKGRIKQRKP